MNVTSKIRINILKCIFLIMKLIPMYQFLKAMMVRIIFLFLRLGRLEK